MGLRRISQKHVDFLICDKKGFSIIGVVELDDRSHFRADRIKRDRFVDAALAGAGIPILHHPVKLQYDPTDIRQKLSQVLGIHLKVVDYDTHWKQTEE